jgi:hypothetical protein
MTRKDNKYRARFQSRCGLGNLCNVRDHLIHVGAPIQMREGVAYHVTCAASVDNIERRLKQRCEAWMRTIDQVNRLEAAGLADENDLENRANARAYLATI